MVSFKMSCFDAPISLFNELIVLVTMSAVYFIYMYRVVKYKGTRLHNSTMWFIKLIGLLNISLVICQTIVVVFDKYVIDDNKLKELLVNLKSLLTYPLIQSIILSFFIFLFKFKEIEIQIDMDAKSVTAIIASLNNLTRIKRLSAYSFLVMKVFNILFYCSANIMVLYEHQDYDQVLKQ